MRNGQPMPYEMLVLQAAKEFGVLPEEVEGRMTARWWGLWLCWKEELTHAR